jgi:integrase
VFLIEGDKVKNGLDRLVVLNRVARSVIDSVRGQHPEHVFVRLPKPKKSQAGNPHVVRKGFPLTGMNTTARQNARVRAADKWKEQTGVEAADGFRRVRVHDLKHTFGRRLRAAGLSFEDRQDLLGHKSSRITTHYSAAELTSLMRQRKRSATATPTIPPQPPGYGDEWDTRTAPRRCRGKRNWRARRDSNSRPPGS